MSKDMSKPVISFDGKKNRIRIGVDVIRLLGMPSYVCLYNNVNCSSIAIGPCDEKIVMSFKVPEKMLRGEKCECEISSKQFVSRVINANHLDFGRTYRFGGIFNADKNKVIFAISDMASYKL